MGVRLLGSQSRMRGGSGKGTLNSNWVHDVHTCHPALGRLRQEDCKFMARKTPQNGEGGRDWRDGLGLRALVTSPENSSSIPSTHTAVLNRL